MKSTASSVVRFPTIGGRLSARIRIYSQIRVSEIVSEVNYISTNIYRNVLILVSKDSEGYRELIHKKKLAKFPFGGGVENHFRLPSTQALAELAL